MRPFYVGGRMDWFVGGQVLLKGWNRWPANVRREPRTTKPEAHTLQRFPRYPAVNPPLAFGES
jgi:hypothetical protein